MRNSNKFQSVYKIHTNWRILSHFQLFIFTALFYHCTVNSFLKNNLIRDKPSYQMNFIPKNLVTPNYNLINAHQTQEAQSSLILQKNFEENQLKAEKTISSIMEQAKDFLPYEFIKSFQEFSKAYVYHIMSNYDSIDVDKVTHKIGLILKLVKIYSKYEFKPFNKAHNEPYDFYEIANDFWRPLIDLKNSDLPTQEALQNIAKHLSEGSNIILLSNHQTEPDPQIMHIIMEHLNQPELARKIIYVAGHRVRTDPLAIPFSLGCNMVCVHSKKHLEYPPEEKAQKLRHNLTSLKSLQNLLEQGGQLIWMAPSGGRDRPDPNGEDSVISPFDPRTIEIYVKVTEKLPNKTYFIPMAMYTAPICPPPKSVNKILGESRTCSFSPIAMAMSKPLMSNQFQTHKELTNYSEQQTRQLYNSFFTHNK